MTSTPSSHWHANGEPDPHGARYNCERSQLAYGQHTDDELANAVYLCDHRNDLRSMALLTAAKERIRWLSRSLTREVAQNAELIEALRIARQYVAAYEAQKLSGEIRQDQNSRDLAKIDALLAKVKQP